MKTLLLQAVFMRTMSTMDMSPHDLVLCDKHRHDTESEADAWFMRVYGGAWNGLDNVNNTTTTYYSGHRVGLFVTCLDWEGNAPYHQAEGSLHKRITETPRSEESL